MSTETVIRCDNCARTLHEGERHWRLYLRGAVTVVDPEELDFCSPDCIETWATAQQEREDAAQG